MQVSLSCEAEKRGAGTLKVRPAFSEEKAEGRRPYTKPSLAAVSERELLEAVGPAQGYNPPGRNSMIIDSEWKGSI